MKRLFLFLFFIPFFLYAEQMYSPTWGFFLDIPEGYEYIDGDGKDRFSFLGPSDAMFDIVVYDGTYLSMQDLVSDINRRIANSGDADFYNYHGRQAALIELNFGGYSGWGLCVELTGGSSIKAPMLLALAYGPKDIGELELFHISALDSIAPSFVERYYPGPVIEYSYPRGETKTVSLAAGGIRSPEPVRAMIHENDAKAAQVLIEREYLLLQFYLNSNLIQEAWSRYYRLIFRDSYDRITFAASALVQNWGGDIAASDEAKRIFAQRALSFVQGFNYERDMSGSDFVNLVSAITEGRGDCDSRAVLWAIILSHADIRGAIMLSSYFSHAMGLAEIEGSGARFEAEGTRWLVAETIANIDIGLIDYEQSDPRYWFAVIFE